jgi:hypothetical protein
VTNEEPVAASLAARSISPFEDEKAAVSRSDHLIGERFGVARRSRIDADDAVPPETRVELDTGGGSRGGGSGLQEQA